MESIDLTHCAIKSSCIMASAREYSNLTDGLRRDVVAMIEKAIAHKRKGEGLIVHGSQCHGFIDSHLETVRETSYIDGAPQRAMTLISTPGHTDKLDLSLGISVVGADGQAASKAAKKWGSKVGGREEARSRLRKGNVVRVGSFKASGDTLVLETERVLRARRDASVTVHVRERDAEITRSGRRLRETPSWSSVCLTAEEIFREASGKYWLGDKDSDHVYCTVRQSCNVDKEFLQFMSTIQLHLFEVTRLPGFQD